MSLVVPIGMSPSVIHELMMQPGFAPAPTVGTIIGLLKAKMGTPYDCPKCARKGKVTVYADPPGTVVDPAPGPSQVINCDCCGGWGYTRDKLVWNAVKKRYVLDEAGGPYPTGHSDPAFVMPSGMIPDNFAFLLAQGMGVVFGTTMLQLIDILKAASGTAYECRKCLHTGKIPANPGDEADLGTKACDLCGRWGYTLTDYSYNAATDTYTMIAPPTLVIAPMEELEPIPE